MVAQKGLVLVQGKYVKCLESEKWKKKRNPLTFCYGTKGQHQPQAENHITHCFHGSWGWICNEKSSREQKIKIKSLEKWWIKSVRAGGNYKNDLNKNCFDRGGGGAIIQKIDGAVGALLNFTCGATSFLIKTIKSQSWLAWWLMGGRAGVWAEKVFRAFKRNTRTYILPVNYSNL